MSAMAESTAMNESNKARYEIAFLLRTAEDLAKVTGVLTRHGAEVASQGPLNQIALAYQIKKESTAHFGFIQFLAERSLIALINQDLSRETAVLRFLIVESPIVERAQAPKAEVPADAPQGTARSAGPRPGITTNEVLEKRLEEILK